MCIASNSLWLIERICGEFFVNAYQYLDLESNTLGVKIFLALLFASTFTKNMFRVDIVKIVEDGIWFLRNKSNLIGFFWGIQNMHSTFFAVG